MKKLKLDVYKRIEVGKFIAFSYSIDVRYYIVRWRLRGGVENRTLFQLVDIILDDLLEDGMV